MNLQQFIINKNLNTFIKLHETLQIEPYNMIVKGDDNRAIVLANKKIDKTEIIRDVPALHLIKGTYCKRASTFRRRS